MDTKSPVVHLYTFCYNESYIIPFFLRHYTPFVERITVFDNQSTDNSAALLQANEKVVIKTVDTQNVFRDDVKAHLGNEAWKQSKGQADWVIVCDIDEFLYHPEFTGLLKDMSSAKYSVAQPMGFEMVSESPPTDYNQPITQQVKDGVRNSQWDKLTLFDPNQIEQMNYMPGFHRAIPEGRVKLFQNNSFKLLHYRYLGEQHILQKHQNRAKRLSPINRKNGWGHHYLFEESKQRMIYQDVFHRKERIL